MIPIILPSALIQTNNQIQGSEYVTSDNDSSGAQPGTENKTNRHFNELFDKEK